MGTHPAAVVVVVVNFFMKQASTSVLGLLLEMSSHL